MSPNRKNIRRRIRITVDLGLGAAATLLMSLLLTAQFTANGPEREPR